jgi:hypothetical protein
MFLNYFFTGGILARGRTRGDIGHDTNFALFLFIWCLFLNFFNLILLFAFLQTPLTRGFPLNPLCGVCPSNLIIYKNYNKYHAQYRDIQNKTRRREVKLWMIDIYSQKRLWWVQNMALWKNNMLLSFKNRKKKLVMTRQHFINQT